MAAIQGIVQSDSTKCYSESTSIIPFILPLLCAIEVESACSRSTRNRVEART